MQRARAASIDSASRLASPLRAVAQRVERGLGRRRVAAGADLLEPRDLAGADLGIVDLEDVEMLLLVRAGSG